MLEAFSVGVRIRLIDQVSAGLLLLSGGFRRSHTEALQLQRRLDAIKLSAAAGGAMIGLGIGGFALLKPALEQAKLLQQAQARFATFGMGEKANADAFKFSKAMNVIGSSYVDNLNYMIEAQGVFRESGSLTLAEQLRGAKLAAPILAQIHFSTAALHPNQVGRFDAQSLAMLRFIETRGGVNDPREFNRIANLGFKAIQSSGGNINWEFLRQFMATGATAAQGLSDEALFGKFEPLIGELKSRAGTALATAYNRMEGITRVPNQVAHLLVDSGIWRKNAVVWNSMGGIKQFRDSKSPLVDSRTFQRDPVAFYEKTLLPVYRKMGLDKEGIRRENAVIFGRTGGLLFNLIDRQLPAIHRSVAAQNRAMGIGQSVDVARKTAIGQEIENRRILRNLEADTGRVLLPLWIGGLKVLNPLLLSVSTWARRHPGELKAVILGFTGLSAAMVVLGGVAVMGSALQAILLFSKVASEMRGAAIAAEALSVATSGPVGLISVLGKARVALLGLGLAAAAFYYVSKHPIQGTFDKGHAGDPAHWHPNWTKGTWLDKQDVFKPVRDYAGHIGDAVRKALDGVSVKMDGKLVGQIVMDHAGKQASRPGTGPSIFDTHMSPLMPDMSN